MNKYDILKGTIGALPLEFSDASYLVKQVERIEEENKEMLIFVKEISTRLSWTLSDHDDKVRAISIIQKVEGER